MANENMTVDTATPSIPAATATQDNPPALVKKIGKMTYIVRIHFSETSTETMEDKIKRMLKNEVRQLMENE
ncbi:MAG: transposon-encoded TnpW family protein [Oscillospiraceae bacterium]|nr:transposon-encoded TnpW family protein [Oscillospiraceae bacterium]